MPPIDLPDNLYARLEAFRPLIEAVIEEPVDFDACIEAVLERGLQVMLTDVLGTAEPDVLLASMHQLATQHPEAVYGFVAETMKTGAAINREKARHRIGFTPSDS